MAQSLVREGRHGGKRTGIEAFSPTQRRVAKLLCVYPPLSTEEIVEALQMDRSTLQSHLQHMLAKVDLYGGIRALTVYLMHHGYQDK